MRNKGDLMSDLFDGTKRIGEDIIFDDLVDFSAGDEVASSVIRDASSEGVETFRERYFSLEILRAQIN